MRLRIKAIPAILWCALLPVLAQEPSFDADHVYYVDHPVSLAPGLILSIFGNNLGPSHGCATYHDEKGIYPRELCDTQVLVGGVSSELLWAQSGQINFRVPRETPEYGTAAMAVVYQGRTSKAVAMPLGFESPTIAIESPARVGMPVWLKINMPYDRESGIRLSIPDLPCCVRLQ